MHGSSSCLGPKSPESQTRPNHKIDWITKLPGSPTCLDHQVAKIINLLGSPKCPDTNVPELPDCLDHQTCLEHRIAWITKLARAPTGYQIACATNCLDHQFARITKSPESTTLFGSPNCLDHSIAWMTKMIRKLPISSHYLDKQLAWIMQLHESPTCMDQQLGPGSPPGTEHNRSWMTNLPESTYLDHKIA